MKTQNLIHIAAIAVLSTVRPAPAGATGFAPWDQRGIAVESFPSRDGGHRSGESFPGLAPWRISTGGTLDASTAATRISPQEAAADARGPVGFSPWSG